MSDEYDILVI